MFDENEWKSEEVIDNCIFIEHLVENHKTFFEIEDTGKTYTLNFYPYEGAKLYWDNYRANVSYDLSPEHNVDKAFYFATGFDVCGVDNGTLMIDLNTHDLDNAKSLTKDAIKIFDSLLELNYKNWKEMYPDLEEQIEYHLQNNPPEPTQTKTSEQSPASDRQIETAQKAGYVQGVCESVLAFNNDENRKIMTEATMTFLSKKLLSEMNVTKDMAQKFANPETYKALEQSVFAPKQEQQLEQTQTRGRGI
jgi:hypothetical protein